MLDYDFDEIEQPCKDSGIYPDLIAHLNLFNQVSKITLDCENEKTVLNIKLEDGTWSFFVFYDIGNSSLNKEEHKKLYKSLCFYMENMA